MIAKWWNRLCLRLATCRELLEFFAARRPWLLPMLLALLMMSAVVMLAQASQIAPFIYTLF